jgi:hypothetical protein
MILAIIELRNISGYGPCHSAFGLGNKILTGKNLVFFNLLTLNNYLNFGG